MQRPRRRKLRSQNLDRNGLLRVLGAEVPLFCKKRKKRGGGGRSFTERHIWNTKTIGTGAGRSACRETYF